MSIYRVANHQLKRVAETSFGAEGINERKDIQRMLREQIGVLADQISAPGKQERLLVVAEEFGDWLDSSRRIDLLCVDGEANLVVVELKRTDDGGHMELQALRYAAMVSSMTFEQLVDTFARYRNNVQPDLAAAKVQLLEFFGWSDVLEDEFGQDTRIILASADFSKELTTAVMWLIERSIDIRCVRMKPYRMEDIVLLQVEQIIPLPETSEFQTQIGVKKQAERNNRSERHEQRLKFWEGLLEVAKSKTDVHAGRKPTRDGWLYAGIGRTGFNLGYTIRQSDSQAELWISHGSGQTARSKAHFKALEAQKDAIQSEFGADAPLDWQDLPEAGGCRIRYLVNGGYRSPQEDWPRIHADLAGAMARLDKVMRQRVAQLPA